MKVANFLFVVGCSVVLGTNASHGVMNDKILLKNPSSLRSPLSSFFENVSSIEEDEEIGSSGLDEDEIRKDEKSFFLYGTEESKWKDLIEKLDEEILIKKINKIMIEVDKYIKAYKKVQEKLQMFIKKSSDIIKTKEGNSSRIIRGLRILMRLLGIKRFEWTLIRKFSKKKIIKNVKSLIEESKKILDRKHDEHDILLEKHEEGDGDFQTILKRHNINLFEQNHLHKEIVEYGKEQLLTLTLTEYKIIKCIGIDNMNKSTVFDDLEALEQLSLYIHELQKLYILIELRYLRIGILPLSFSDRFQLSDEEYKEYEKRRKEEEEQSKKEIEEYKKYDKIYREQNKKKKMKKKINLMKLIN